jgi:hypothetical protein
VSFVSQSLSRYQAVMLGFVVLVALALGGLGLARIADRQGLWSDSFEVTAGFPEVHDVTPGTPVRIRGVDAGEVVGVEYPDHDSPGAEVAVRMRLSSRFASRVYADATAQIHGSGMLGSKVIALNPGTPQSGSLPGGRVRGLKPFNMDEAVADIRKTADEVRLLAAETKGLVKEVRESNGTLMQLVKDDSLHKDIKALVAKTDKAVGSLEKEVAGLNGFIQDGRETMRSVKQGTDAIGRVPIIRSYVENSTELLVRPNSKREMWPFQVNDIFEPYKPAELSGDGHMHMNNIINQIKARGKDAEVVVVAFCDPADKSQTPGSAMELSKKQAQAVVDYLKAWDAHKAGTFARRKITPLGMGMNPSPVVEKDVLPPSVVQIMIFTPQ